MLNSGIISIDVAFSYYFIFEGERIFFMSISIPEDLGKELDKLLVPILGNSFQIKRNLHGVYVFSADSGHVVSLNVNGFDSKPSHEISKRKTS